jgi:DNA-binding cell septation regulator SpoVG
MTTENPFEIVRMHVGQWGHIKAFFDVKIHGFGIVKGFKLVQGKTDLFIGVPSVKSKDDEYNKIVILTDDGVTALLPKALELQGKGGLKLDPSNMPVGATLPAKGGEPAEGAGVTDDDIPF